MKIYQVIQVKFDQLVYENVHIKFYQLVYENVHMIIRLLTKRLFK